MAYLEFFPELQVFFDTWTSSRTIYYHLQKDANVNNPTNTFVRIDVWRFSDVLFICFTIGRQLFQITTEIRDELDSLHTAGRVYTTCVFSVCTRLGLRTVLGLGLALESYRVYHTAGRMLIGPTKPLSHTGSCVHSIVPDNRLMLCISAEMTSNKAH